MLSKFKAFSVMNEVVDESNDDDDDEDDGNTDGESGEAVVHDADETSEIGLDAGKAVVVVVLVKMESVIVLEGLMIEAGVDVEDGELFTMRFKRLATLEEMLLSLLPAVAVAVAVIVSTVDEADDI